MERFSLRSELELRQQLSSFDIKPRHIPALIQVAKITPASAADLAEAYREMPGKNKAHLKMYQYALRRVNETVEFREKVRKIGQGSAEKEVEIRRAIHWHNLPEDQVLEAARLGLRSVHEFQTFAKIQRITGGAFLVSNRSTGHQKK